MNHKRIYSAILCVFLATILIGLLCIFILLPCYTSLSNVPNYPISDFLAFSAVIYSNQGDSKILLEADCNNLRLWIKSWPVEKEIQKYIYDDWSYMIIFSNERNVSFSTNDMINFEESIEKHYVYINVVEGIIQFDDQSYAMYMPDMEIFIDGFLAYFQYDVSISNIQCNLKVMPRLSLSSVHVVKLSSKNIQHRAKYNVQNTLCKAK